MTFLFFRSIGFFGEMRRKMLDLVGRQFQCPKVGYLIFFQHNDHVSLQGLQRGLEWILLSHHAIQNLQHFQQKPQIYRRNGMRFQQKNIDKYIHHH